MLEYAAQLNRYGMPARKRHRHVRDEPANVAGELAIGRIALRQLVGVPQVGAADGFLPGLNVPAPIARWRRLRRAGLAFRVAPLSLAHSRLGAALFGFADREAVRLANPAPRLPWRGFRFDAQAAQLAREPLAPLLEIVRPWREPAAVPTDRAHRHMHMGMAGVVVASHEPIILAGERLARPGARGRFDPIGRRARRHGQDDGDALRRVRAGLAPRLRGVRQEPIIMQGAQAGAIGDPRSVLRFGL
jgi:hypothetical protein